MAWETDDVYKYLSGESHSNEIYDIHKIHYRSETEVTFFLIYIILLFVIIFIFLSGCIHALFNSFCKCCKREDNFRYSYFFIFTIYVWEYLCDILFISFVFINHYNNGYSITDIHNEYTILLLIALSCLSFTYLFNTALCCRMVYVLYKHNKRINDWFHSYFHSISFITVSLITFGPFVSMPLFNSHLFGLSLCSIQISKYDMNYILAQKFFNIITQLLPLFFLRMVYLFWIKTFNIIILSSLIPISLSFCISSWYLCCDTFYAQDDKYLLRALFEVYGTDLCSLRHLGFTKHLQYRFCELFNIKNNEMEVFKAVDCSDSITTRFEMRFIVKSDEETLERVEHRFLSCAQNGELVKAISETYNIDYVYINKQMTEIVANVHLLWGLKTDDEKVLGYNNIPHNKSAPYFDPFHKHKATENKYQRGELRNVHIDVEANKQKKQKKQLQIEDGVIGIAGYQAMKSRSSSSFNHPPIQDVYKHDMQQIAEEDHSRSDDENQQLCHRYRHNIADASSLDPITHDQVYETNDIQMNDNFEDLDPVTPQQLPRSEDEDQFDVNYRPLSSQEIRLKNWEAFHAQANNYKAKHKQVMTPSFSISTMDQHEGDSVGSIIASPPKLRSKTTVSDQDKFGFCAMISVSEIAGEEDVQIGRTLEVPLTLAIPQELDILQMEQQLEEPNEVELVQELQLDTTVQITHQTKSVMVDPKDVEEALSFQSKPSVALHMVAVKEECANNNEPQPVEEVKTVPIQPPTSVDSGYGDYVFERDHSESLEDEEIHVEVHYDQILHKPRTSRKSLEYENKEIQLEANNKEDDESTTSSDSYDTHTPTGDTDEESTSQNSSDTIIVHKRNDGPHYQYNKVIAISHQ